jgi:hypothetical protein
VTYNFFYPKLTYSLFGKNRFFKREKPVRGKIPDKKPVFSHTAWF